MAIEIKYFSLRLYYIFVSMYEERKHMAGLKAGVCEFNGHYFLYVATRDPEFKIQKLAVATAPLQTNFNREDWTQQEPDKSILEPELPWEGKCIEAASIAVRDNKLYMLYAGGYNN